MNVQELKNASGARHFASVMGKSSIPSDSPEYKLIEDTVTVLMENGFGIIHGGYSGGAMSAASDTATAYLKSNGLPAERNIGIPQAEHEVLWERTEGAIFTDTSESLFTRLRDITSGDIGIFAPLGGDGTEVEESIVFHENVIRMANNQKPMPMIFLMTENGTQWDQLLNTKLSLLTSSIKQTSDVDWIHFVKSSDELKALLPQLL